MYVILRSHPDAEPILATRDARVVDAVLRAVAEIAHPPAKNAKAAPEGGRREETRRGRHGATSK